MAPDEKSENLSQSYLVAPEEKSENLGQSYLVAPDVKSEKLSQQNESLISLASAFLTAGSGGALWVQRDSPDFRAHTHLWAQTDLCLC